MAGRLDPAAGGVESARDRLAGGLGDGDVGQRPAPPSAMSPTACVTPAAFVIPARWNTVAARL